MLSKAIASKIVGQALDGKKQATAVLSWHETQTSRLANNEISQNIAITDGELALTMYDGKRRASAKTNVLTPEGIASLRQNAEKLLKIVPESEFGFFDHSTEVTPEHSPDGTLSAAFATDKRANLLAEGVSHVKPGYLAAGALELKRTAICVGAGSGQVRYSAYDEVSFNTVVTHDTGAAGAAERASYTGAPDVVLAFKNAQATSEAARDPITPTLGEHTVILSPSAFGTLVSFLCYGLNAKSVIDGISYACGKLDHKLFSTCFSMRDNVGHPDLRPLHFDIEGNPRRPVVLVEDGVITSFVNDNITARKLNTAPTGHAIAHAFVSGGLAANVTVGEGDDGMEEIISSTKKGIFINELHYTNFVNPRKAIVTGLTRNGTFLIEDGKLTRPLSTVRYTVSLLDVFCKITALSAEREKIGGGVGIMLVPAARVDGFCFTSRA